ncbi:MAG: ParM/StbA family protein [Niameybacter sp.]
MAMKEYVKKIAIDLGSANLKIAGEVSGKMQFKKIKSKVSLDAIDDNYTVTLNNRTLYFGVGDSLVQQDKTNREYIEETILLAVHEIYGAQKEPVLIDLAIGLPLNLYKSENKKEYFDTKLHSMKANIIAGFVNGDEVFVKLNTIKVFAEGYSGFMALHEKMDTSAPFMIVDLGYRTTDVLSIDIDDEGEMVISGYKTFDTGMLEVFNDIQKAFLNDTGSNTPVSTIENCMVMGHKIKVDREKVDVHDWFSEGSRTIKTLFKDVELHFPDFKNRDIYLVGGGSYLVDEIIKFMIEKDGVGFDTQLVASQDELIYCNVMGYFIQL